MNINELKLMQNYPLELKVEKTKLRIKEWYEHYNGEVYVSFSGGKETLRVRQIKGLEKGSKFNKGKWQFLLDAPFKISEECCNELKKKPMKEFQKQSGKVPFIATMADEGLLRQQRYLQTGCNAFNLGKSQPMGFWTEQDVLRYIKENNLEICSVYGDIIINDKGLYETTGEKKDRLYLVYAGNQL